LQWQSEPLGTYSETYRGLLAIDRDMLVYTTEKGEVRTFARADGKPRWRVQLDERVKELCVGSEGELVIATADDQLRFLSRADGKQTKSEKAKQRRGFRAHTCPQSLPTDGQTPFELLKETTDVANALERKLDLDIDAIVEGPGGRIASGQRPKGTRVTTLIGLDAENGERWRTTASADPLGAEGAARTVTVGNDAACIIYYGSEHRLACFALADGKRLWDEPAPSFFEGLYAVGDTLVMTTHRQIEARDIHTGKIRWALE
jgi:outer membrane protein assembly factor BamB